MMFYVRLILECALFMGIVLLSFRILLTGRKRRRLNLREALQSDGDLEAHAQKTAVEHKVFHGRHRVIWPIPAMNENYGIIASAYRSLNEDIRRKHSVPSAAEWLLDNFYLIEELVKLLRRDLARKSYARLPVLESGMLKGQARIFAVAVKMVAYSDGQIDEVTTANYLRAYQAHSLLKDCEIWALPMTVRLALLKSIGDLCEGLRHTQVQWRKADQVVEEWLEDEGMDPSREEKLFRDNLKSMGEPDPSYMEHLLYRLRRTGRNHANVLRILEDALARSGETMDGITLREHRAQSLQTVSMGNCITSLRLFAGMDWSEMFEAASSVEQILRGDPDGTYPLMDLFTRNHYRSRVEDLARQFAVSERHIAQAAITLAKQAKQQADAGLSERHPVSRMHVGYYLVGPGIRELMKDQKRPFRFHGGASHVAPQFPGVMYLGSIGLITLFLVAMAVRIVLFSQPEHVLSMAILGAFCVLIPASEIAVGFVNHIVCKLMKPAFFPRMDLAEGIPETCSTIVAIPALLSDRERVHALLENLEGHYLTNREPFLYFALLGAFSDASGPEGGSGDEALVEEAMQGVQALNRKYAGDGDDKFFFFHRKSYFNEKNNKWIGWERKRGALMEFNEFVLGSEETSFAWFSNRKPPFGKVKYVITLDSDTVLPMGTARRLVGTMVHPLNQPVVDPNRGIVVEGYGLMQPRVDVDIESANHSHFSRIFAGQEGVDPYANAISDVYQDLFGEGIFTGKGIYDLRVFQGVLENAIPENAILSHDLLEGSYVRTGLVSDLKLVDSFPSKYNAWCSRAHRWARGDWQLSPLLLGKILDRRRRKIANPLTLLSRWKMLDNLRRSLLAPAMLLLVAACCSLLPGTPYFWLGILLLVPVFPLLLALPDLVMAGAGSGRRTLRYVPQMAGLKGTALQGLLMLTFLPHQAVLMGHAITVTLGRVFFTKRNLLEWIPSADVEKIQKNTLKPYLVMMQASLWAAPVPLLLAWAFHPAALPIGLALVVLWLMAPVIAWAISRDRKGSNTNVTREESVELGRIARKTWRYFEEFVNEANHYLAPDNYQADPPRGVAARTSPTNIGLGLLSILSARDFGYIGTKEMTDRIGQTLHALQGLERWNGHFLNWYDTRTARPLRPRYVSTVDSGNLAGYLVVLSEGLTGYLTSPLIDGRLIGGIRDTLACAGPEGHAAASVLAGLPVSEEEGRLLPEHWHRLLYGKMDERLLQSIREPIWRAKTERAIHRFRQELAEYLPGCAFLERMPEGMDAAGDSEATTVQWRDLKERLAGNPPLNQLPAFSRETADLAGQLAECLEAAGIRDRQSGRAWLHELQAGLLRAADGADRLIGRMENLRDISNRFSREMSFLPLYIQKRRLFSIGYHVEEEKLTNACYDLFASEARLTSYLCIARGELPPMHWYRLGRALTVVDRYKGLVSWTGTMFEYLMPLLVMRRFENTLLDETYSFVLKSQMKYGRQRNMPWGVSESGFFLLDRNNDYQYKAIGVPWLGLKRGLIEDAVVAPYATFLAITVDPAATMRNLQLLREEGLEGPYGFHEAVDYTPERLPFETRRAIVRSYMAHHQGMSLLAIDNRLHDDIMQRRFHADPAMHAARLLLQEKVPNNLLVTKDTKEKVIPFKEPTTRDQSPVRRYTDANAALPGVHILTNGNYAVMLTERGTGYSRNRMAAISRWREDAALDACGMFFWLRDMETHACWSATSSPLREPPDEYEVIFTADKATYRRCDGSLETRTEVIVTSGDNAEIRRISLKNRGETTRVVEVTSNFEVVLAPQAADVAHPAFGNLFVETAYLPEHNCLMATRRPRADTDTALSLVHAVVVEGKRIGDLQYETDRMQWLGRGNDAAHPISMERGHPLSNTTGPVLDPVMCLRVRISVEPGKTVMISFLTAVSESREMLVKLIDHHATPEAIDGAFRLALARSQVETKYLNLDASEMVSYQNLLSHLLFLSPWRRLQEPMIRLNRKGQSSLWRYGISGDAPIVLVTLLKSECMALLRQLLDAHEYWRLMGVRVDLVVLCEESYSYTHPLYRLASELIQSSRTQDVLNRPGDIFLLDRNHLPDEDVHLLHAMARLVFLGDGRTLEEQTGEATPPPLPSPPKKAFPKPEVTEPVEELPEEDLQQFNGIGGFSQAGDEYVIRLEKRQTTPAPWVNVVANPRFGFLVSESGSGYTWHANSRENKLTPWSNDMVSDPPGEALYLCDTETGCCWSVSPLPIREETPYAIRHGFGYSVFEHNSHGIAQRLSLHVPVAGTVKVGILTLRNLSDRSRSLSLTQYVRPVLGVTDQTTALHIRTSLSDSGALLMENPANEEYPGQCCFLDASIRERSVTADRAEFFGSGHAAAPACLANKALSGRIGTGLDPCGAMQVGLVLTPHETREVVFLLGTADSPEAVDDTIRAYRDIDHAKASLSEVRAFWQDKRETLVVETPTASMNLLLNGWLTYQIISCRLWARSGFYQAGGAFGFRDQLQDCLALLWHTPQTVRAQILLHAAHQFTEGDVLHWWHEPQGRGTRTRISDDLLWLPYTVAEYIRATGDGAILHERVPFLESAPLHENEDERYEAPGISAEEGTLYEHCLRAVTHALRTGEHGLPLMGGGDWNDGMNKVGSKGQGESVWLGWFLIAVLDRFAPLCLAMGDAARAASFVADRDNLAKAIDASAWDGDWYRRAWFDNGMSLGSAGNRECRIDAIAQSWAVLSGAGDPERARQAMESLEHHLVSREDGLIRLLTPPFGDGELEPGYIKGYVPGVRENGGQYTHAAAWVIMALAGLGDGDKAWEMFELVNPIHHADNPRECMRYKVEPYVMAADVYAVYPHTGRGGWTWYTGSASWMYQAGLTSMLGFRKEGGEIVMDPCIPQKWKSCLIRYRHGETRYEIHLENPAGESRGVQALLLDGIEQAANRFPLVSDGKTHMVIVRMGA